MALVATSEALPLMIAGDEVRPESGIAFDAIDPATGDTFARVSEAGNAEVNQAVDAGRVALDTDAWRVPSQRVQAMAGVAHRLRQDSETLARLESRDTGKPLAQAQADVAVAARYFEYYGGLADKLDGRAVPLGPAYVDYTIREPWGICGVITPWNYPLQIAAREVAPALATGNAVILKPSREASLSAIELARIARDAGVPSGRFSVLTGSGATTGANLVSHPGLDYLSFTGSAEVGRDVAALAAQQVRPISLELGGKSPNIVFGDADIGRAVPAVLRSILQNAGQTCSAGSRLIVHESVAAEVTADLVNRMQAVRIGPGLQDLDLGPLISERQREGVRAAVENAATSGAVVATGGKAPQAPELARGFFFEPTLIDRVDAEMPIAREEVFGPVLSVLRFRTEDEAIALANDSPYGLVAAVWTRDVGRAHRVGAQVCAGQVYINTYGAGGGVELPFGGTKRSGFGRSKGLEGLHGYTRVKNICIAL